MTDARNGDQPTAFDAQQVLDAFATATEHAAVIASPSGVILAVSEQATQLFGPDPSRLVGKTLFDIEGPENADAAEKRLGDTRALKRVEGETSCMTAAGSRVPVRVVLSPIRDASDDVAAVLVAYRSLVKDKQAALTLNAVLEHLPEGIAIADAPDAVIRAVSRYGIELTSRNEDEVIGTDAKGLAEAWEIFDADGIRQLSAEELPIVRAVRNGEIVRNELLSLRNSDGSFVSILCNAGPILGPKGTITGGVIAWRDVSEIRDAEKQRLLLLNEMHHRVKNAFALVNSLVAMVGRSCASPEEMSKQLRQRIGALARAQELVRFDADAPASADGTTLRALAAAVLSPFTPRHGDVVEIRGPDIAVPARSVPKVALILTELATNAVKHGSLSVPGGSVSMAWSVQNGCVSIEWTETASGLALCAPETRGFGSRLLQGTIADMQGDMHLDWRSEGLRAQFRLPEGLGTR